MVFLFDIFMKVCFFYNVYLYLLSWNSCIVFSIFNIFDIFFCVLEYIVISKVSLYYYLLVDVKLSFVKNEVEIDVIFFVF